VSKDWLATHAGEASFHSRPRVWSIKRRATTFSRHQNHRKPHYVSTPESIVLFLSGTFFEPCKDAAGDGERENPDLRKP
jgi:hypothetical protein